LTTPTTSIDHWSADDPTSRVLVVTAHPDDVDFGAAGTVATFTAAGIEVAYCIVTNGEAGGSDRSVSRQDMATLRQTEQRAAAAQVGVSELTFLGYPDGRLTPSLELRRDISAVIRRFRPERVITQSPERSWDRLFASHPDHLAAGEAAICAVYPDARNPFAHPELLEQGLEPHTVAELWVMAAPGPNMVVDTTAVFERKVAALMSHQSQVGEESDIRKLLTSWSGSVAAAGGLPEGRMAENFRVTLTG
jgi:LmbE family N-acetylglucosaminyl deacetylase